MKNISIGIFFICSVLFSYSANAQMKIKYDKEVSCSFFDRKENKKDSVVAYLPQPQFYAILQNIVNLQGLDDNFGLYKTYDILCAEATLHDKSPVVLYNPDYFERLDRKYQSKWPIKFIIAHEMGHHLNAHIIKETGSQPDLEKAADFFAGNVLRKLDATLEQTLLIQKEFELDGDDTHPSKLERIKAITAGWEDIPCKVNTGKITFKNTTKKQIKIMYGTDPMWYPQGNVIVILSGDSQDLILPKGTHYFNATLRNERNREITLEKGQINITPCQEILKVIKEIGGCQTNTGSVIFKNNLNQQVSITIVDEKGKFLSKVNVAPKSETIKILTAGKLHNYNGGALSSYRHGGSIMLTSCEEKIIEYGASSGTAISRTSNQQPNQPSISTPPINLDTRTQTTGRIGIKNQSNKNIKVALVPEYECGFSPESATYQQEITAKQSHFYKNLPAGKYCLHVFKLKSNAAGVFMGDFGKAVLKGVVEGINEEENIPNTPSNNQRNNTTPVKYRYVFQKTYKVTVQTGKETKLNYP